MVASGKRKQGPLAGSCVYSRGLISLAALKSQTLRAGAFWHLKLSAYIQAGAHQLKKGITFLTLVLKEKRMPLC